MPLPPLHRRLLIALAVVLLLPLVLLAGALAVVESQWCEDWVEARLASALGREVELEGIDVELGRPLQVGFQRLRIGNPAWAETKNLIDAHQLQALVEIAPLFERKFDVAYLGAKQASFGIERFQDRASWKFTEGERGESRLKLQRVFVHDGQLHYRKKEDGTSIDFQVTGALGEDQKVEWAGKGTFRNMPAEGSGTLPSMAARFGQPIPVVAKARIGKTDFTVDGTVAPNLKTLDFKFTLAGQTMKDLRTLFKLNMPDTPPYRLAGTLERDDQVWKFNPFQGKVGDSDLRGRFTVDRSGKQPLFTADLQSKVLDLDDVGPMIGTPPGVGKGETANAAQVKQAAQKKDGGKFFPDVGFNAERWGEMDADVRLKAERVKRPKQLPLDTMAMHVTMKSKVLRLKPLEFGIAGGRFKSDITIDATKKPVRGNLEMEVAGLSIARMFPAVKSMEGSFGTLYGRGKLTGTGESMHDLLASSHGDLGLAVNGGQVSLLLVELLGLDFGEALGMLGTRNKQVALRCAAGAFNVDKGIVNTERFIVDTTDTVVKIEGTMSLADEKLHLVTYPEPKDASLFALRSPIVVEGSLKKPSVRPKGGPIAARLVGAAALAAIAPPLAALAFIETGPGKDTDCGKLLAEANAKGAPRKPS